MRQHNLNDIICRALASAQVPAKESELLSRIDGQRPGGLTLILWKSGIARTWDVTLTDACTDLYLSVASVTPALVFISRISHASRRSSQVKYEALMQSLVFQPLAFETRSHHLIRSVFSM